MLTQSELERSEFKAMLGLGEQCVGPPGLRPHYTPTCYAAFVRDLDGHKVGAMWFTGPAA